MEEQVLAERCRQGDNLARKELYEQYAGRMLGVCLRYAGDRETAKDLMHDGFLKLFDSFDKFTWRGEGSFNTCLPYKCNGQKYCIRQIGNSFFIFFKILISSIYAVPAFIR